MADNRGGKRKGSGRQPGPLSVAHRVPPRPAVTHNYAVIEARAHEAGALLLRGFSITETAAELGVDRQTVSAWMRRYPEILESERRPRRDPAQELAHLVPTAVRAYGDTLQPEVRADIRLHAADSVMDRVFGKPQVTVESHSRQDIRVLLLKASDLAAQGDA